MHVNQQTEKMMQQNMGMIPIKTPTGIRAFYQSLASENNQIMVWEGDTVQLRHYMKTILRNFEQLQRNTESDDHGNSTTNGNMAELNNEFYSNVFERIAKGKLSKEQFINSVVNGKGA